MHEHHRQRMLARLEKSEGSLQEHELLEILLFNAIPRKNTNEIAHSLIRRFGSVREALKAPMEELRSVDGIGGETAAYLKILGILYKNFQTEERAWDSKIHVDDFLPHLAAQFVGLREEIIGFYLADRKGFIRFTQCYSSNHEARASVQFDDVAKFITGHACSGLIVAHNHPTQVSQPSKEDDLFTVKIITMCALHKLRFYDHIVFGINGSFSYRRSGRLEELEKSITIDMLRNN